MMWKASVLLLVLVSFKGIICDVELKVFRGVDDVYNPVAFGVEERAGNNLTLVCDLTSSGRYQVFDDQIVWGKSTPDFSFKNKTDLEMLAESSPHKLLSLRSQGEPNRARKRFTPLRLDDSGMYFCGSLKYKLFEVVYVSVKDAVALPRAPLSIKLGLNDGNIYCNEKMFKCRVSTGCIHQRFVCDKKPDCNDGSDESIETCNGDPCKDKLQCDDGRCIPTDWCCDKDTDHKCNVTYPPKCCQHYSRESALLKCQLPLGGNPFFMYTVYDESEYPYNIPINMTEVRTNVTRKIFVSLCILATFFSILLMLLILSKVFVLAKKTTRACPRVELFQMQERAPVHCNFRGLRYTSGGVLATDVTNGTVDALLILSDDMIRHGEASDRPPSYTDVMEQFEPPPPYTSQDCLNRTPSTTHYSY